MKEKHYEFVQMPAFAKALDAAGNVDLLGAIEDELLKNPEAGVLLKGGIRKVRIAAARGARGKRGGYRVWHYFYQVADCFILLYLLDKKEAANISKPQEAQLVAALQKVFDRV